MVTELIESIINSLYHLPRCFTDDEILTFVDTEEEETLSIPWSIKQDPRFVVISQSSTDEPYIISSRVLYKWFIRLNFRLAKAKIHKLSIDTLSSEFSGLRIEGRWTIPPPELVVFGNKYSFIGNVSKTGSYNFPLSYVFAHLPPRHIKDSIRFLIDTFDKNNGEESTYKLSFAIHSILETLSDREEYVVTRRQGLFGHQKMTLESIGQELGLTRERIRQIESKSWRKLIHPNRTHTLINPFMYYMLHNNFEFTVRDAQLINEMQFVTQCLHIPLKRFPYTTIYIIGLNEEITISKEMLRNRPTVEVLDDLISHDSNIPLSLNQIEEISRSLLSETVIHVNKTDRVYEALRQIGVPSHYSQIADTYNDMFPDDYSTENVIHATLSREQDRIVWIGMKGTFALKEWGFERPSDTLFNTIAEIVKEQYSKNGKPVAINTIQAELGKYRKVVNLNSVILASYCNEQITNVYKDYFIPIEFSEKIPVANGDTDSELLDRILRQFETQVNKEESTIMPEQII